MSLNWYEDPKLFLVNVGEETKDGLMLMKISNKIGYQIDRLEDSSMVACQISSKNVGGYKVSDFDDFLDYLVHISNADPSKVIHRFVNHQGVVICSEVNANGLEYTWEHEPYNSPFYKLPGISNIHRPGIHLVDAEKQAEKIIPDLKETVSALDQVDVQKEKDEKEALEKTVSDSKARISALEAEVKRGKNEKLELQKLVSDSKAKISALEAEVKKGKHEKLDLQIQVSDLTTKLKECCEAAAGGGSAPSNKRKPSKTDLDGRVSELEKLVAYLVSKLE